MTNSILIFTFSPVQSFIAEARRAADLYTGSQILVRLAQAAAKSIGSENLVYPAQITNDVPNKLVAVLKDQDPKAVAENARKALLEAWQTMAEDAKREFLKFAPAFDETIWQTQTADNYLWEVYWSAVVLENRSYAAAYQLADSALNGAKLTRVFDSANEPGFKDSLSGKRQALHNGDGGKEYWNTVGKIDEITPIKIRPNGRERLDSIAVIKRFHPRLSEASVPPFSGFPSTSSMASLDYLEPVRKDIKDYKDTLAKLFGKKAKLMEVRKADAFPYDGDFLYLETLTSKRLKDDYGIEQKNIDDHLNTAKSELQKLKGRPSPYYAIIVLDGDSMGKKIETCLKESVPEEAHTKFSQSLLEFSYEVNAIADKHHAKVIYNGGDDVLAMSPLGEAYNFASALAAKFKEKVNGTASAGIAITHHHSPLSAALRSARAAEEHAKAMDGKNAVCIKVLRRSGEGLELRSHWDEADKTFAQVVKFFTKDESDEKKQPIFAGKLPYDIAASAYALNVADEKSLSEIKRLIKRHSLRKQFDMQQVETWAGNLNQWASTLPNQTSELAGWLTFARFVAQGGSQ